MLPYIAFSGACSEVVNKDRLTLSVEKTAPGPQIYSWRSCL